MTVLVTGGSGLVGAHVIRALRDRGLAVRALVRPASRAAVAALGAEPALGDVTDAAAWRAAARGVSGIVHAAAWVAPHAPRDAFFAVNVGGTRQAIAAARESGARLVHVSSVAVYGRAYATAAGPGAVDEDFPFGPIWAHDYYAQSKRAAEDALWEESARGGFEAVAIRPDVIYGEYDRLFTPRVARLIRRGWVPQIGTGDNRLACVYAGNVARAIELALESPRAPGRAFNVTDDGPGAFTQRGLVDAFAAALGARPRRLRVSYPVARFATSLWARGRLWLRPGAYPGLGGAAVRFLVADNPYTADRARRELGWTPVVAPADAVRRAVRWLAANEKPGP